jgi:hypothetical protein
MGAPSFPKAAAQGAGNELPPLRFAGREPLGFAFFVASSGRPQRNRPDPCNPPARPPPWSMQKIPLTE